jgi:hypothetical protein
MDIGNTLGSCIKIEVEKSVVGLSMHAHIFVDIDLNKGLMNKMILT